MQRGGLQLHGQFTCEVATTAHEEGKQPVSCGFAYVISRVKQKDTRKFYPQVFLHVYTYKGQKIGSWKCPGKTTCKVRAPRPRKAGQRARSS